MSEIKVTFGALEAAQADVATTAARISGSLEDLKRYLAPMVATWEGQAAAEYRAQQQRWDTAAAGLADVLARIGPALGAAKESYMAAERLNVDRWG